MMLPRNTSSRSTLVILGLGILAIFAGAELFVRARTNVDADGNAHYGRLTLHPYRLPVRELEASAAAYAKESSRRVVFDPDLGWTTPSGASVEDGLYQYDAIGARVAQAGTERALEPSEGVLRIELFGDSFTHGDRVAFDDAWAARLGVRLAACGVRAEVIDLGVPDYGLDQALLRWRKLGRGLAPRLVVLGFQPGSLHRSVNMIRALEDRSVEGPFAKPRFITDGDRLELVGSPVPPPSELPRLVANLQSWPLLAHERYFRADDYVGALDEVSRLVALLQAQLAVRRQNEAGTLEPGSEREKLATSIVRAFDREAREIGADFLVVHLPRKDDLRALRKDRPMPQGALLAALQGSGKIVDPTKRLLALAKESSLDRVFIGADGRYDAPAHDAVAEELAESLCAARTPVSAK